MKHMIIPSVANCVRFYALPKIHKPILTFRPFISNIDTDSYESVRFFLQSLAHLTSSNFYLVKTYDFIDKTIRIFYSNYICFLFALNFSLLTFYLWYIELFGKKTNKFHYFSIKIEITEVHFCVWLTYFVFNDVFIPKLKA